MALVTAPPAPRRCRPADVRVDVILGCSLLGDTTTMVGGRRLSCPVVLVAREAWRQCEEFSHLCWACEKPDSDYNSTYHRSDEDPRKAERCGWVAEVALARLLGKDCHWLRYRHGGDRYDILHNGWRIDSKGGYNQYGSVYITSQFPSGREATLWSDLYVRSIIIEEDRVAGWAKVAFLCFCTSDTVLSCEPRPGAKNAKGRREHEVYAVRLKAMSPIAQFLEMVSHAKP